MTGLVLLLAVCAIVTRIYVLQGVRFRMAADEGTYLTQASAVASGGRRAFSDIVRSYLCVGPWENPGPLRFGHIFLSSLWLHQDRGPKALQRQSAVMGALTVVLGGWVADELAGVRAGVCTMALLLTSPLLLGLGRRALQDASVGAVAAVSVLAIVKYAHGASILWPIAALTALLSIKEAAAFMWPAFAVGLSMLHPWAPIDSLVFVAPGVLWLVGFKLAGGRWRDVPALVRIARECHAHAYTQGFQSGLAHRTWLDLFLLAPVVSIASIHAWRGVPALAAMVLVVLVVHGLIDVKNVRFLLIADVLERAIVGVWLATLSPWLAIVAVLFVGVSEIAIFRRVFLESEVYDPVTVELVKSMRMVPR